MNYFLAFCIFTIILFLYIHIVGEYSRSEDLEIYEMDYINNKQFQEVCNIKQPVLFEFQTFEPQIFQDMHIQNIANSVDLNIIDANDYWKDLDTIDSISIPLQTAHKLIETDTNAHFFTENNTDFVEDANLGTILKPLDDYFKPYGTIQTSYDFMMGSKQCAGPLRYHTDYRRLVCVSSGKIHVKMTPWKSSKYLDPIKDFEKYEFRSPVNVWNPQQAHMHSIDKIKFLEFDVLAGYVLYIPPYWWYSIKYSDSADTCAFVCSYNTIINRVAHIPDIGMYMLQQQNITKKTVKTLKLQENINVENTDETAMDNISDATPIIVSNDVDDALKILENRTPTMDLTMSKSMI